MILESYRWRPGARVKVDPKKAGEELLRIKRSRGKITTDVVVKESIPKKHIFHDHIWKASAKEAEAEYRRNRAAEIMRGLFVIVRPDDGEPPVEVPAFPNVNKSESNNKRQCLPVEEVYSSGELRRQVIETIKVRLHNLRRMYGGMVELAKFWEEYDRIAS
jgi:hypothetical protein